jgi:hypothetical protein
LTALQKATAKKSSTCATGRVSIVLAHNLVNHRRVASRSDSQSRQCKAQGVALLDTNECFGTGDTDSSHSEGKCTHHNSPLSLPSSCNTSPHFTTKCLSNVGHCTSEQQLLGTKTTTKSDVSASRWACLVQGRAMGAHDPLHSSQSSANDKTHTVVNPMHPRKCIPAPCSKC